MPFLSLFVSALLTAASAPAKCEVVPLDGFDRAQLEKLWTDVENCTQRGQVGLDKFSEEIQARINALAGPAAPPNPPACGKNAKDERPNLFTAHARGIALALGESGVDEPAPPVDQQTQVPIVHKGLVGGGAAPAAVVEALTLVSDIAVKRARQHGLGFLKTRLELAVCGVTLPNDDERILPATCELVVKVSPEKLVGDPRVIQVALFQDLLAGLVTRMIDDYHLTGQRTQPAEHDETKARQSLDSLVRLAVRIAARTLSKRDFAVAPSDALTVLSAVVDTAGIDPRSRIQWGKARAIPYGLAAGVMFDADKSDTLPDLVRALEKTDTGKGKPPALGPDEFARALEIANLTVVAASATRGENLADGNERLIAALDLVFECVLEYVTANVCDGKPDACTSRTRIQQVRTIVHAAADRDVQNAVSGAVRLLLDLDAGLSAAQTELAAVKEKLKTAHEKQKQASDAVAATQKTAGDALSAANKALEAAESKLREARNALSEANKALEAAERQPEYLAYRRRIEKAAALVAAIAAYAETYAPQKSTEPANTEPTAEELRKKRQAVLEGLIDATTVRDRRHGEWVFSLGIPVGFSTGFQYIRERERDNVTGDPVLEQNRPKDTWGPKRPMYPQLELPLGFAAQKLVGHRYVRGRERPCANERLRSCDVRVRFDGVHMFVSMIDLGQFLAFDDKGKLSRPRWDSFISPGAQLGWIIGRPQNSFILGVEARYAPTLFAGTSELTVPADTNPGGAARFGVFVAYYISLFDFN